MAHWILGMTVEKRNTYSLSEYKSYSYKISPFKKYKYFLHASEINALPISEKESY